jgi:YVTN family beta-propeller protein
MKTRLAAFVLGWGLCGTVIAQNASLLVLSKRDHTLAIVDAATLQVKAKAPVGEDPHEVTASADGLTAWVSNYGGGRLHTLAVIDLVEGKALPMIDLGPLGGPHGLMFAAGKVWFTAEAAKVVGSVDPTTQKVDLVLGTGQDRTHMIWVSADAKQIVTTNVNSATVSIIDKVMRSGPPGGARAADWTETVVSVGPGAEGFDVSPDGREIWTANASDGTVSVIDRVAKKVVATLPANAKGANRLKFTPNGSRVLITTLSGQDVIVLDAHTRAEMNRIPVGRGAAGIEMDPSGARAFVACTPDNYVSIIDLKALAVTGHIDAGGEPDGMAWAVRR